MSSLKNLPGKYGRWGVISVPYLWLGVFFLIPFLILLKLSITEIGEGTQLFQPMFRYVDGVLQAHFKLSNYVFIWGDDLYFMTYLRSLGYAALTTLLCLLIGYPFSYAMSRAPAARQPALLMLVMLPFWTSFLIRIYAWKGILANNGVLNNVLLSLHVIDQPLQMLNTPFSLTIGMVYAYLPFMILPLYANLIKHDGRLLEAAADLGATPTQAFWRVTVPLSKSGVVAGSMLVFIPCVGEYVIPELLGGPETLMIGRVLWDEFFSNNDWPMAASVAVVMILLVIVPIALFNKYQSEQMEGSTR
jgi:putrescine transport system permease protein